MNGPDWQTIAQWLVGLISALVGFYAKGISARVTKLEADQGNLHALVKGDYPTREEIARSFTRVEEGIRAITSRLDNIIDHNRS